MKAVNLFDHIATVLIRFRVQRVFLWLQPHYYGGFIYVLLSAHRLIIRAPVAAHFDSYGLPIPGFRLLRFTLGSFEQVKIG